MTDLKPALEYLGAREVERKEPRAFSRYAMKNPSGRWLTFSEGTLEKFASGALNNFRYQVTIGRAFVLMPVFWTPNEQYAWRHVGGTFTRQGCLDFPFGHNPTDRVARKCCDVVLVTADLATGEVTPA